MPRSKFVLLPVIAVLALAGCTKEADDVNKNLSTDADNFKVFRKITFVNGITDKVILEAQGFCSVDPGDANRMTVTCKDDQGRYLRHALGKSDNVFWFYRADGSGQYLAESLPVRPAAGGADSRGDYAVTTSSAASPTKEGHSRSPATKCWPTIREKRIEETVMSEVTESVLCGPVIRLRGDETDPLGSAVRQCLGAASVCWDPMNGSGIFQEQRANAIADELVAFIRTVAGLGVGQENYAGTAAWKAMFRLSLYELAIQAIAAASDEAGAAEMRAIATEAVDSARELS